MMRTTPLMRFFLVAAILMIPLGWWLAMRDPAMSRRDSSKEAVNVAKVASRPLPASQPQISATGRTTGGEMTVQISGQSMIQAAAPSAAAFMARAERMSLEDLLAEFE